MIGTIVDVEIREPKVIEHEQFLAIRFLDDYEQSHMLYVTPYAPMHMKEFCAMTYWDYKTEHVEALKGKIISVDSEPRWFRGKVLIRWFIRSNWKEY